MHQSSILRRGMLLAQFFAIIEAKTTRFRNFLSRCLAANEN